MIINQTGGGNVDAMMEAKYNLPIIALFSFSPESIEFYDENQGSWLNAANDWNDVQDFNDWFANANGFEQVSIMGFNVDFAGWNESSGIDLFGANYEVIDGDTGDATVIKTIAFYVSGAGLDEEVVGSVHNLWLNTGLPEYLKYSTEANAEDPNSWVDVPSIRVKVDTYDENYDSGFWNNYRIPMGV